MDILHKFYKDSNDLVQASAPHWVTVLHDSFRPNRETWSDFMQTCVNCALDTHIYQAWAWPNDQGWYTEHACMDGDRIKMQIEFFDIPIIVGEWSLAVDNCAMWLNGFNDNVPGYPLVECERIKCPEPYMGSEQANAPPDPSLGAQDPFGTGGESYVINGTCPRDGYFSNEDAFMRKLAYTKLNAFDYGTHGQFFWNFRTELEPRWDYQAAVAKGWLPSKYDDAVLKEIAGACDDPYDIPESALQSAAPLSKDAALLKASPFELFSRGGQPYPYKPTGNLPQHNTLISTGTSASLSGSSMAHVLVSLSVLLMLALGLAMYYMRQSTRRKWQYASISSHTDYTVSTSEYDSERQPILSDRYQKPTVDEIHI